MSSFRASAFDSIAYLFDSLEQRRTHTQLVTYQSDDYICKAAKTLTEATQLIEAGFEYQTEMENINSPRKENKPEEGTRPSKRGRRTASDLHSALVILGVGWLDWFSIKAMCRKEDLQVVLSGNIDKMPDQFAE